VVNWLVRRPFTFEDNDVVRFRAGFTLVELLVVIAIIGILAALLLPTLSKGKTAAQSAACKGNLRQLGIALNMYVSEYDKYPGNGAMYDGAGNFQGIWAVGMNWLKPYLGGKYDPNDLNDSQTYWSDGHRTIFSCPAVKPRYYPGLFGAPGLSVYSLDYGYNELGTGWKDGRLRLGLGYTIQVTGYADGGFGPLGPRNYVKQEDVRSPSEMVAIGDGGNWLRPNVPGGILNFTNGTVTAPHSDGANIMFCDGHVGYGKREKWVGTPNAGWKQWNNDDQLHPETW